MTTYNNQRTQNQDHTDDTNVSRSSSAQQQSTGSSNRGFASMDEEKQRDIASKGGTASHKSGNAHEFDSEEARDAGHKGGQNSHQGRGSGSSNQNR
jgi:uncharacterized protein